MSHNKLREAIREIAFGCAGGVSDMADHETDAILDTVLAHLPEELVFEHPQLAEHNRQFTDGYNAARRDIKDILMSSKGEK